MKLPTQFNFCWSPECFFLAMATGSRDASQHCLRAEEWVEMVTGEPRPL